MNGFFIIFFEKITKNAKNIEFLQRKMTDADHIGHFSGDNILIRRNSKLLIGVNIAASHRTFPRTLERNELVLRERFRDVDDVLIG